MNHSLQHLRAELMQKQLANQLNHENAILHFMSYHVFCVWDFQSLLKALQQQLTGVQVPWFPTADREARRLINEIVLDEESGPHPAGGHASHFELYLDAMTQAGADTKGIEQFLHFLHNGHSLAEALISAKAPRPVQQFVQTTFQFIERGSLPQLVAAFFYGREDIIPDLFRQLVARLSQEKPERWRTFQFYLEEHIHCDEEKHGPAAEQLLQRICQSDAALWAEAEEAAQTAIQARLDLWDAIAESTPQKSVAA